MAQLKNGKEYLEGVCGKNRPAYIVDHIDLSTYPEAQIRFKIAQMRGWFVCKSGCDEANKQFWYERVVNANATAMETVSFDQVCKELHWSKFELLNNGQTIKWTRDPKWTDEIVEIMDRCAKTATDAAALAEAEAPKKKLTTVLRLK